MAGEFQTFDVDAIKGELHISLRHGDGYRGEEYIGKSTYITVEPPLNREEYDRLVASVEPTSRLGQELAATGDNRWTWTREEPEHFLGVIAEGDNFEEANTEAGIELAKAVMAVRGVEAAVVTRKVVNDTNPIVVSRTDS
jgi:hypothetical protein